jgi:hypothetical protein
MEETWWKTWNQWELQRGAAGCDSLVEVHDTQLYSYLGLEDYKQLTTVDNPPIKLLIT